MITARVRITTDPRDFDPATEAFAEESLAELIALAESYSPDREPVRLEVEYIDGNPLSPTFGEYPDWDVSGDAVEVAWTADGAASVVTLPPYSEQVP